MSCEAPLVPPGVVELPIESVPLTASVMLPLVASMVEEPLVAVERASVEPSEAAGPVVVEDLDDWIAMSPEDPALAGAAVLVVAGAAGEGAPVDLDLVGMESVTVALFMDLCKQSARRGNEVTEGNSGPQLRLESRCYRIFKHRELNSPEPPALVAPAPLARPFAFQVLRSTPLLVAPKSLMSNGSRVGRMSLGAVGLSFWP